MVGITVYFLNINFLLTLRGCQFRLSSFWWSAFRFWYFSYPPYY